MSHTIPLPFWAGMDVYVIGGGPSLREFNWELLKGSKTIGCNDAYLLGSDICQVCIYGDVKWWNHHKERLAEYDGLVYSACSTHPQFLPVWVKILKREARGLQTDGIIGWNGNTGMAALNLALLFGASRIYLLGFDMKRTQEHSNWHDNSLDKNPDSVYTKFLGWSDVVKKDWEKKFPDVKITNVNDDSDLKIFPTITMDEFWKERKTA